MAQKWSFMTPIPEGATSGVLWPHWAARMKRPLGEGTMPSRKHPYEAVFPGSLVLPICNTRNGWKLPIYLHNFCLQRTFKSNMSFDVQINPIESQSRYCRFTKVRWPVNRKADTESHVFSVSIPCSFSEVSQSEHSSALMHASHCSHLPSATLQRLLQLLKLPGRS